MRCPKCQYIGFDSSDRCRNCGYEFAFAVEEDPPIEVTIRRDEPGPGRLEDMSLSAFDTPLSHESTPTPGGSRGGRRGAAAGDLPLFTDPVADDEAPLVSAPAVPRPPLSVRRANPSGRHRGRSPLTEEALELTLDAAEQDGESEEFGDQAPATDAAGLLRRFAAGFVDLSLLGSLAFAVVYLTLRVSELTTAQWRVLPVAPMAAFLLLLYGGYFVLFTAAGGQTIGKMIAGIRVVAGADMAAGAHRVSFNTAVVRAVVLLGSALPLGAGFLPVLFSTDRRAFHDRIAETRVIPA